MEERTRIKDLQKQLAAQGLGGALIAYSRNILYYTGTAQPAWLVVLPDDYMLYVRSGMDFARREAFIPPERVQEERRLEKIAASLQAKLPPGGGRIGIETDILNAAQYLAIGELFRELHLRQRLAAAPRPAPDQRRRGSGAAPGGLPDHPRRP